MKLKLVEEKKSFPKQQEKKSINLINFRIQWGIFGTMSILSPSSRFIQEGQVRMLGYVICHLQAAVKLFVSQPKVALKYMLTSRLNRYCQWHCSIGYP